MPTGEGMLSPQKPRRRDRDREPVRALMSKKMGVEPGLWRRLPPGALQGFESQWEPVERWAAHLSRLPDGLLAYLAGHPRGYLLVGDCTDYHPGALTIGVRTYHNLVRCDYRQLDTPFAGILAVGYLLDHLLGCDGETEGAWLSDGGGTTPALREIGGRISRIFALGYAIDEEAAVDRHAYLARSLAWYVTDRRALNVADPQMERLLTHSLLSEPFWAHMA